MRKISILSMIALSSASASLDAAPANLPAAVAEFLRAYASGNKAEVLADVAPDVKMYGSDVAEFYSGKEGAGRMFDGDMKLWRGAAKFGAMQHVTEAREGNLESIFFDVPFAVGSRPPVTVRLR